MNINARHEPFRIQIVKGEKCKPFLIQNAYDNHKPFIHPIKLPEQNSSLTENQPYHHWWQQGIFTGLHGVNGYDFWNSGMGPLGLENDGTYKMYPMEKPVIEDNVVKWYVKTDWNTRIGETLLEEYQYYSLSIFDGYYLMDIDWVLHAEINVEFEQCDYGGLFVLI